MHRPLLSAPRRPPPGTVAFRSLRAATLLVAVAACVASTSADATDVVTETRPVGNFRTVRLVGSADLVLTQADKPTLSVEGERDVVSALKAEIHGDELLLSYEPRGHLWVGGSKQAWWSSDRKGPRFLLSAKTLDRISTAGNGDIRAETFTVPGDFEISIAGSSDIRFNALAARKLLVRISGAGDVTLSGGVLEQNVRIAGSGDYHGATLQSASATISIGGSGDAVLWARDSLSVKIAGSGDVKYYGRPIVTKSIAGSGSVTGLGDKP